MPCWDHMKSCFVNKLTTSTKMNYLDGLVCCGGWSRWVLGHMPHNRMCTQDTARDGHSGLKRLICLSCLEYFQCNLMTLWALSWLSRIKGLAIGYWQQVVAKYRGYGQIQMVECFFWKVLSHFIYGGKMSLKVKVHNPCKVSNLSV
jgi:hypothetical protein